MSPFWFSPNRACDFVMVTLKTFFASGVFSSMVVMLLCVNVSEVVTAGGEIRQLSPCSCQIEDKIIDLSPLGNKNNTPRWVCCFW